MKNFHGVRMFMAAALRVAVLALASGVCDHVWAANDVLAVGDESDNTVKLFDAPTGQYLIRRSIAPGSGGLLGPTGIVFDRPADEILVANQNVGQPFNGEVLRYDAGDGHFIAPLVSHTDPNSPYAPRGIVTVPVGDDTRILIVADLGDVGLPGKLLAYRLKGNRATYLANLDPNLKNPGITGPQFHPRGVVLGPDGYLYVSLRNLPEPCGGSIARFDPVRLTFKDILVSNPVDCSQNKNDLQRPEGLVFGPDGNLYVTSFRQDPVNLDPVDSNKILVIPNPERLHGQVGPRFDRIELDRSQARAYAQALVFGPDGYLYVPVINADAKTGEVRRYNVVTKGYWLFVPPGRGLGQPFYLSFGKTNPATLDYEHH